MQSALVSRASDPLEEEAGSGRMRCLLRVRRASTSRTVTRDNNISYGESECSESLIVWFTIVFLLMVYAASALFLLSEFVLLESTSW